MQPLQEVGRNVQNRQTTDGIKPTASQTPKPLQFNLPDVDEYEYSDPYFDDDEEEENFDEDNSLFIPDIDQRNIDEPRYVPLIAEKIVRNCQQIESQMNISTEKFAQIQTNLTPQHHELALAWIVRAFSLFKLNVDESLYKSIYYLNKLLCTKDVPFTDLQLISVVCIWIACKVEDNIHIPLNNLVLVCSNNITESQIKTTEPIVVSELECNLNPITPLFYIRRFLDAIDADEDICTVANLFMDISLLYHEFLNFTPTVIAVSAVCVAKLTMNEFCPTPRLLNYSHIADVSHIKECCASMIDRMSSAKGNLKCALWERFKGDFSLINDLILDRAIINQL